MKLRRQVRDSSTGQWAPKTQAVLDPKGTVTETIRGQIRCPCCDSLLDVQLRIPTE